MDRNLLLRKLPPFSNNAQVVTGEQSVSDIIREVLDCHEAFASHYDQIFTAFDSSTVPGIARKLFDFCKANIRYRVEGEEKQTTRSPAAILSMGPGQGGDCKHYALFIGGVLDSFRRSGVPIRWGYRFASYSQNSRVPQHVFVVVYDTPELWVDPVLPAFNFKKKYFFHLDKTPVNMLTRLSGIGCGPRQVGYISPNGGCNVTAPELTQAVNVLLKYGVITSEGIVNDSLIQTMGVALWPADYIELNAAREKIRSASLSGFFDTIFRGIKKVALLVPRNAYLSLVGINAFGYATKLKAVVSTQAGKDKVKDIWQNKFGGDWSALENTINTGAAKKAILGLLPGDAYTGIPGINVVGAVPAVIVPAWITTAAAIIAALAPLLAAIKSPGGLDNYPVYDSPGVDPATGLPYPATKPGIFSTQNLMIAGAAGLAIYFMTKKRRGAR